MIKYQMNALKLYPLVCFFKSYSLPTIIKDKATRQNDSFTAGFFTLCPWTTASDITDVKILKIDNAKKVQMANVNMT